MSTTPDRLENITDDYHEYIEVLRAALAEAGDILARSPYDPARAWHIVTGQLQDPALTSLGREQMTKLLAVALVWLAAGNDNVRRG